MPLKRSLLLCCSWTGWMLAAAPSAAQDRPGPRSGPAVKTEIPAYATPGQPAMAPAEATPAPAETLRSDAVTQIVEVRIVARTGAPDAVPPRDWQPPQSPLSGLRLEHRRGEPLDAGWVRRQFTLNGVEGSEAGRAVALVQLVNRAFLTAGFVNSGLLVAAADPARPGLLVLDLVHGRLVAPAGGEAVAIRWAGGHDEGLGASYVRRRMRSASRQPLSAITIERDFRLLAEDPAIRTVNARLDPGAAPGEASLSLDVLPRERADFYVTAANSRSPSVGGERIAAGGSLRHLIVGGDLLSGEAGTTRGALDAFLAYTLPLLDPATNLTLRGSIDRAAVIDRPLAPLDIKAREQNAEAALTHRFIAEPLSPAGEGRWSPSRSLSLGIGVGWRRQRSFLLGLPFSFAPGSVDGRAEYVAGRLLGDYVVRGVDRVFALSATATLGLSGTRSNQPLVLNPGRHFKALLVQLNAARRLSPRGLELRVRLTGQMSDGILYSGERLGIGGESSVRGYRESLVLADRGIIGSIELAQPFSLSHTPAGRGRLDWGAFAAGLFLDGAKAWNARGPAPLPARLASIGPSLTWQPSDALTLDLAWGIALTHAQVTGSRDLQDHGFHFRLTVHPLRLLHRSLR